MTSGVLLAVLGGLVAGAGIVGSGLAATALTAAPGTVEESLFGPRAIVGHRPAGWRAPGGGAGAGALFGVREQWVPTARGFLRRVEVGCLDDTCDGSWCAGPSRPGPDRGRRAPRVGSEVWWTCRSGSRIPEDRSDDFVVCAGGGDRWRSRVARSLVGPAEAADLVEQRRAANRDIRSVTLALGASAAAVGWLMLSSSGNADLVVGVPAGAAGAAWGVGLGCLVLRQLPPRPPQVDTARRSAIAATSPAGSVTMAALLAAILVAATVAERARVIHGWPVALVLAVAVGIGSGVECWLRSSAHSFGAAYTWFDGSLAAAADPFGAAVTPGSALAPLVSDGVTVYRNRFRFVSVGGRLRLLSGVDPELFGRLRYGYRDGAGTRQGQEAWPRAGDVVVSTAWRDGPGIDRLCEQLGPPWDRAVPAMPAGRFDDPTWPGGIAVVDLPSLEARFGARGYSTPLVRAGEPGAPLGRPGAVVTIAEFRRAVDKGFRVPRVAAFLPVLGVLAVRALAHPATLWWPLELAAAGAGAVGGWWTMRWWRTVRPPFRVGPLGALLAACTVGAVLVGARW